MIWTNSKEKVHGRVGFRPDLFFLSCDCCECSSSKLNFCQCESPGEWSAIGGLTRDPQQSSEPCRNDVTSVRNYTCFYFGIGLTKRVRSRFIKQFVFLLPTRCAVVSSEPAGSVKYWGNLLQSFSFRVPVTRFFVCGCAEYLIFSHLCR